MELISSFLIFSACACIADSHCTNNTYGMNCQHQCKCKETEICEYDGRCTGQCPVGFFGPECQLSDRAVSSTAPSYLKDSNDATCNTDPNSRSLTVEYQKGYFVWMRLVVKDIDLAKSFDIKFEDTSDSNAPSCSKEVSVIQVSATTVDAVCSNNVSSKSVTLQGPGVGVLCTMHISSDTYLVHKLAQLTQMNPADAEEEEPSEDESHEDSTSRNVHRAPGRHYSHEHRPLHAALTKISSQAVMDTSHSKVLEKVTVPYASVTTFTRPKIECKTGWYGFACNKPCNIRCQYSVCHQETGQCLKGCEAGFYPHPTCDKNCPKGFHGSNCSLKCSITCLSGDCHPNNGLCMTSCAVGFHGTMCEEKCDNGKYGESCLSRCPKECYLTCDYITGRCPPGKVATTKIMIVVMPLFMLIIIAGVSYFFVVDKSKAKLNSNDHPDKAKPKQSVTFEIPGKSEPPPSAQVV